MSAVAAEESVTTDGRTRHPLYGVWSTMKTRCLNSNASGYGWYGARGITVCDRWANSFFAFVEDMGERPLGYTLDRIDPNGNYEPGNCRWATWSEQVSTRRPNGSNRLFPPTIGDRLVKLAPQECEVVILMVQGLTQAKIAQQMGLGIRTVATYRERVKTKTGCKTSAHIGAWGALRGLL